MKIDVEFPPIYQGIFIFIAERIDNWVVPLKNHNGIPSRRLPFVELTK